MKRRFFTELLFVLGANQCSQDLGAPKPHNKFLVIRVWIPFGETPNNPRVKAVASDAISNVGHTGNKLGVIRFAEGADRQVIQPSGLALGCNPCSDKRHSIGPW